jgi:TatD DNase family protein
MIDFHTHLDLFADPNELIREAQLRSAGILSVTTTPSAWTGTLRLAEGHSVVRTALGLHPQLARERRRELALFDRYVGDTRFVGEVGLDGSPEHKNSWPDQEDVFMHILRSSQEAGGKVISVHSRRAASAVLDVLERVVESGNTYVLHWFSGTQRELSRAITLGCWFSVGPAMLSSAKGRSLVAQMPLNRILLETDGPFAQVQNAVLKPWDVDLVYPFLAKTFVVEPGEARSRIDLNEVEVVKGS